MHPLKTYLEENKESIEAFAKRVCIGDEKIQLIIAGTYAPTLSEIRRIIEETDQNISLNDFYHSYDQIDEAQPKRTALPQGEIVDLRRHQKSGAPHLDEYELIDSAVLAEILSLVFSHMREVDLSIVKKQDLTIAADAVYNTYSALSNITTRQGQSRLVQALEPIIEGILLDYSALLDLSDRLPDYRDQLANQVSVQYLRYHREMDRPLMP